MNNRKKSVLMVVSALLFAQSFAAKNEGKMTITGNVENAMLDYVMVVSVDNPEEVDTVRLSAKGAFEHQIDAQAPHIVAFVVPEPRTSFKIYAEAGTKAKLNVVVKNGDVADGVQYGAHEVKYKGDNQDCFNYLYEHDFFYPLVNKKYNQQTLSGMTFPEFKRELRADVDNLQAELQPVKNKTFTDMVKSDLELKYTTTLLRYSWVEKSENKDFSAWIENQERNTMKYLPVAQTYIKRLHKFSPEAGEPAFEVNFVKDLPRRFMNEKVYYAVANEHIVNVMEEGPANIDEVFAAYKKLYAGHESDIPEDIVMNYTVSRKKVQGKPVADFPLVTPEGSTVRFVNMKGKALYIDIWATWCGPCAAEQPYMNKLADHYKGSPDVEIVSVSIDADEAAWKKRLKTTTPEWTQYIARGGQNSEFCKRFNVMAIPRFLFIDRNGRIISLDAPRPSSENIIEYIDGKIKR